jgi:AraC-like DNA-binding protein
MDIGRLDSDIAFDQQLTDSMPDTSIHWTSDTSMNGPTSSAVEISAIRSNAGADVLIANPAFLSVLQLGARHMIELYDQFPRTARLVAAQQKWLLTQSAYALHLQRDPADPLSGITASRLLDTIVEFGAASRNTATAFLSEMLAYKLIRDVPGTHSKRSRPLEPTETAHEAMMLWFRGQMRSLDLLDKGSRVKRLEADPEIFFRAQPIAAKRLIADKAWREPPLTISCFVWTEYGGLILDDFVSRLLNLIPEDGYHRVEGLRFSELSTHYSLSRTHLRRLFARAEELGSIELKEGSGTSKTILASESFVDDYKRWQAVKFSALDQAYREAVASIDMAKVSPKPI